jgi:hypothetical protein
LPDFLNLIGLSTRLVKLEDENTCYFQAMATMAHKSITTQEWILVTDHDQKACLLWEAFESRMGMSEFNDIPYNLEEFNETEINSVCHASLIVMP